MEHLSQQRADAVVVVMVRSRTRDRAAIPAVSELRRRDGERKLRADQEEGGAPHGAGPERATPSNFLTRTIVRYYIVYFSEIGEHALCGAHGKNDARPTRLSRGDRVRYVGGYMYLHTSDLRKFNLGLPRARRARCC